MNTRTDLSRHSLSSSTVRSIILVPGMAAYFLRSFSSTSSTPVAASTAGFGSSFGAGSSAVGGTAGAGSSSSAGTGSGSGGGSGGAASSTTGSTTTRSSGAGCAATGSSATDLISDTRPLKSISSGRSSAIALMMAPRVSKQANRVSTTLVVTGVS